VKYRLLGERIKKERLNRKLTQEKLAEMAGVSVAFLGQIERGDRKPSLETVVNISNALGVTMDILLQDSYKKKPKSVVFKPEFAVDYLVRETGEADLERIMTDLAQMLKKRRAEEVGAIININRILLKLLDKNK
jgi:transcriptional regulator with XRE-family HTH domain